MASKENEEITDMVQKMWGYLDHLAETDPEEYQKFIGKAMKERGEFLEPPQPVFCFSTGIRGAQYTLYVNLCKWRRIPQQKEWNDPVIPVKGGVLRHVVENGKKQPNDLLVDIAFNPCLVQGCINDRVVMERLVALSLDFIDDFLSILTDRNTRIMSQPYKGPLEDIARSVDEQQAELLTRESWLDFGESILTSIRRGKRVKPARRGTSDSTLPPLLPWQQCSQHGSGRGNRKLIEEIRHHQNHRKTKVKQKKNRGAEMKPKVGVSDEAITKEKTPEHMLSIRSEGGREAVCVRVCLPAVSSVTDVQLECSMNDLSLVVPGLYRFSVSFPFSVNEDSTRAAFSKRSRTLSITIPSKDQQAEL